MRHRSDRSRRPVRSVQVTGQTGLGSQTGAMVQNPPSPTPLATIPSSAAPSRTGDMVPYTGPNTIAHQGSRPQRGSIPGLHWSYSTQRVSSSLHASTRSNYQADFSRFKEDLVGVLKTKLGIDMGSLRLYQKLYPLEFDFISYPAGWRIPEFVKFHEKNCGLLKIAFGLFWPLLVL